MCCGSKHKFLGFEIEPLLPGFFFEHVVRGQQGRATGGGQNTLSECSDIFLRNSDQGGVGRSFKGKSARFGMLPKFRSLTPNHSRATTSQVLPGSKKILSWGQVDGSV